MNNIAQTTWILTFEYAIRISAVIWRNESGVLVQVFRLVVWYLGPVLFDQRTADRFEYILQIGDATSVNSKVC